MSETKQVILALGILFSFIFIPYVIQGGYKEDAENIVPLFQILIPYLLLVGAPLIITAIIVFLVKTTSTGVTITRQIITGKETKDENENDEENEIHSMALSNIQDMNKRHRRKRKNSFNE